MKISIVEYAKDIMRSLRRPPGDGLGSTETLTLIADIDISTRVLPLVNNGSQCQKNESNKPSSLFRHFLQMMPGKLTEDQLSAFACSNEAGSRLVKPGHPD